MSLHEIQDSKAPKDILLMPAKMSMKAYTCLGKLKSTNLIKQWLPRSFRTSMEVPWELKASLYLLALRKSVSPRTDDIIIISRASRPMAAPKPEDLADVFSK